MILNDHVQRVPPIPQTQTDIIYLRDPNDSHIPGHLLTSNSKIDSSTCSVARSELKFRTTENNFEDNLGAS